MTDATQGVILMGDTDFNRLKNENSSYLKQHKDNPINWWSYGPDALQKAKDENKPIFLSIGYSSCHWCHVMAAESFSNQQIADLLNDKFVCIKVDREEHPDLDSYYQTACQLFIQSGGWPLSAFLLPDMRPYFVGTYYPAERGINGQASFTDLITELSRVYESDKEKVEENASKVTQTIEEGLVPTERVDFQGHFPPPASILDAIKQYADEENGGYGAAPKFPHFPFYEFAVEQMLEGMVEKEQGEHIIKSIEKMLMGGVLDHARGGIHRYSVDEKFLVPHFEKMLYDQAGLLRLLAKTSLLYPSPLVFDTIINTLDYLEFEMLGEENYFFASQDADSEGTEGLYFTYTLEEFEDVINKVELEADSEKLIEWFRVSKEGNFEQGLNIISLNPESKDELFVPENWEKVRIIRKELLESRKLRIPPATDNKGIASWNFMLISSLVDVMQYCQVDVIKRMASNLFNKCVEGSYKTFLLQEDGQGMKLRHTTTKEDSLPYFEDYANFAEAQLRMYEISGNEIFKNNFKDTINYISKEFIEGKKVFTRSKSITNIIFPNQALSSFDQSFKSSVGTILNVIRRGKLLFLDKEFGSDFDELLEESKHESLKNPLNSGETIRANIYPEKAYRVVKVPHAWLEKDAFINFMSFFLPRFVIDYQVEKNENWQVCNLETCELQGEGIDNFINTLRPPKEEK